MAFGLSHSGDLAFIVNAASPSKELNRVDTGIHILHFAAQNASVATSEGLRINRVMFRDEHSVETKIQVGQVGHDVTSMQKKHLAGTELEKSSNTCKVECNH